MTRERILVGIGLALLTGLSGCDTTSTAVFATGTDIGIHADAKLQTATIGYDRIEMFVGPVFSDTGAAPPVVGFMGSNLELFTPKVKQLYATGRAAELVTQVTSPDTTAEIETMSGTRQLMAFGTTTHIGANIGFTAGQPDRIGFGFKRREASVIPIQPPGANGQGGNQYASTIASIDMDLRAGKFVETGLKVTQFIATGTAARNLAKTGEIRKIFSDKAVESLSLAEQEGKAVVTGVAGIAGCIQLANGPLDQAAKARWAKAVDAGIAAGVFPSGSRDRFTAAATRDDVLNILNRRIASASELSKFQKEWDETKTACDQKPS